MQRELLNLLFLPSSHSSFPHGQLLSFNAQTHTSTRGGDGAFFIKVKLFFSENCPNHSFLI